MDTLIQKILDYDKNFGRPSEGSDRRKKAYDEIVELAEKLRTEQKVLTKPQITPILS